MELALEIFGYIGTVLVVGSMIMTSMSKLRIINITGSIISMIYALLCNTWPIVIMNGCIVIINTYQLINQNYKKKHFKTRVFDNNSKELLNFIKNNRVMIDSLYNNFNLTDELISNVFVFSINDKIIGFMAGIQEDNRFNTKYKYIVPNFHKKFIDQLIVENLKTYNINQLTITF